MGFVSPIDRANIKMCDASTGKRSTAIAASLRLRAEAPKVSFGGNTLKNLKATAALKDLTSNISGQASIALTELTASNAMARNLSLALRDRDGRLAFAGQGLVNKAVVNLGGSIRQQADSTDVSIDRVDVKRGGLSVRLAERAQLSVAEGAVRVERLRLITGRGSINVRGVVNASAISVEADLARVPTSIANVFAPALGLDGSRCRAFL